MINLSTNRDSHLWMFEPVVLRGGRFPGRSAWPGVIALIKMSGASPSTASQTAVSEVLECLWSWPCSPDCSSDNWALSLATLIPCIFHPKPHSVSFSFLPFAREHLTKPGMKSQWELETPCPPPWHYWCVIEILETLFNPCLLAVFSLMPH